MMRFYKNQDRRFYAGVDLHARSMYVCRAFFTDAELTCDVEAALIASQSLTGTVPGRDSFSLNGRDWCTHGFLGRDTALSR
jgi:hypothetical protein